MMIRRLRHSIGAHIPERWMGFAGATYTMAAHPFALANPVRRNELLNGLERALGRTTLWSYPLTVGINTSNICNQHCRFCFTDNARMRQKNWLTADVFEGMTWLRHVPSICLSSGLGDPLVNPHFAEIAATVRRIAPRSSIFCFTNGQALSGANLDAIVHNFSWLHVSVNAVREDTYSAIIQGDYQRMMTNLRELARRRPKSLKVELSLVLVKQNVGDVKPLIDFASECGFEQVSVCHYVAWTDETTPDLLGATESVRNDPDVVRELKALAEYSKTKRVSFYFPQTNVPLGQCQEPWTSAFLTTDEWGERTLTVCCSGSYMNLYTDLASYRDFRRIWNSDRMRMLRRTVNAPTSEQNTLCRLCRMADKMEPDWIERVNASHLPDVHFGICCPYVFERETV